MYISLELLVKLQCLILLFEQFVLSNICEEELLLHLLMVHVDLDNVLKQRSRLVVLPKVVEYID